ncbi:M13 family metallopeptidase [Undibacterium cyanobacteriorum]|uniref:M13 family metallopeptidase n=1 Tax=Undibacterium cyanobacteriorum TaxID=3073561 RepID=A0ABY9RJV9_9BURK|nr:M13 family metallopeptidase [Undibacterium sp. 20NA77.5]WMW81503.1 M13 family metallopeptidase [Undibacterium sp. 20NA77.5]
MQVKFIRTTLSLMISTIFAAGVMTSAQATSESPKTPSKAMEPDQKAAEKLGSGIELQWIDKNVRPQDDFFRFTAGKWLDTAEIPADKGRTGSFDALADLSLQQCREIIEALAKRKDLKAGTNQQKIADMYASFMDEARIEAADIKPLKKDFAVIDKFNDKAQLPKVMAYLARIGVATPIGAGVTQDAKDSSKYAVSVGQSGLSLPDREYYLKLDDAKYKDARAAYLEHVEKMLSMAGMKNPNQAAQSILAFETEIAKIQWSNVENRNPVKTYNKVEINKLNDLLANFDWNAYLTSMGTAGKIDYVVVRQPSYLTNFAKLIDETPVAVWQTYFKWRLLNAYAPLLSKRFVEQDFKFNSAKLRGIPEMQPRWKRAVASVEGSLSEALGQLFVEKHFPASSKARMQELVNNLLLAYKQSIETLPWMGEATKKEALAKLSKFTPKIGYPDKWRDYSALSITRDSLLANIRATRAFNYQRMIDRLGKPVDRAEWGMSPQTVNAYYNPRQNEIVFPAAILRPPFFNPDADDAVNYGGIGAVIGHEIGHGFDDSGSQSDGDGNLRDWWTAEDKANFKKLTDAMVEQYNSYSPIEGYKVNGKLTLGENIGDNSGLAIAYKAYQISLNGKNAPVIDGFTGNQRVFLGWAQVWRGKSRNDEAIRLLATDPHSPAMFRANGPLTNIDAFYEAFGVKPGDKMYVEPAKRITIW